MTQRVPGPRIDLSEVKESYLRTFGRLATTEYVTMVVDHTINQFLAKDGILLANGVGERCICHKLAEMLALCFPTLDVDCEYNRMHYRVKEHDYQGTLVKVTPDIIVHKRVTTLNLLVVEAKVTTNSNKQKRSDAERLAYFTGNPDFKYRFGLSLTFETRKKHLQKQKDLQVHGQWFRLNEPYGDKIIWRAPMDPFLRKCIRERMEDVDDA